MFKQLLGIIATAAIVSCGGSTTSSTSAAQQYEQVSPAFCADSAYSYIAQQCSFGPRTMNSEAHEQCAQWIVQKFTDLGCEVMVQEADSKLYDGTPIRMKNIIASVNPTADVRLIISSHWDSRPWADHDADESNHHTAIDGANDGASGVGIMIEIARLMQQDVLLHGDSSYIAQNPHVGVDFICWDAEDCGTPEFAENVDYDTNTWCLGSQYWAEHHHIDGYTARWGILLDMVGGKNTMFKKEPFSLRYAPQLVDRVWAIAGHLGYDKYFVYDSDQGGITDDHLEVNKSGIPCIDIIGCNREGSTFPATWHTVNDNIHNIDKPTLQAVGQTVIETIYNEK